VVAAILLSTIQRTQVSRWASHALCGVESNRDEKVERIPTVFALRRALIRKEQRLLIQRFIDPSRASLKNRLPLAAACYLFLSV
jgi:hypothetical protein